MTMRLALGLLPSLLAAAPSFEKDILPIFTANCFSCHGGTSMVGLDLRTAAGVFRGSHQGQVVVKSDAEKSLLYQKMKSKAMPPPAFNFKVTEAQIALVAEWINAGCPHEGAPVSISEADQASFTKHAAPLFERSCKPCHLSNPPAAGLDLRTLAGAIKGSASGPVVQAGASDKSLLIRKVAARAMPPPNTTPPLGDDEIATLRRWIDTSRWKRQESLAELRESFTPAENPGVTQADRDRWPYRKVTAPTVPAGKARHPVDAFLLDKLAAKGLAYSPEASPLALLRRASFDLTGLPPSPDEMRAFLADTKPGAWERLIDRLLDSPHYGERQARHWLDAAGYVDVTGFDNDLAPYEPFEGIWRYRDYVVRSFNSDKPYDRFLIEQLAGDELHDWRRAGKYTAETIEALTATGYLRSVYDRTDPDIVNLPGERYDVLFHLMEKVSTHLLGLTVGCARCHSHKYDPIPQRDYYRMAAVFQPAFNPWNWKQPKNRWLADVSKSDEEAIRKHNEEIDKPLTKLKEDQARLRKPYEEKLLDQKLVAIPEAIRGDAREAYLTPADQRDDVKKYLVTKFGSQLRVPTAEIDKALNEADRAANARIESQKQTLESYRRSFNKLQALWDVGPPPVSRLLQRGMVESPGPRVTPGAPAVLGGTDFAKPAEARGDTSGYRLSFARWLASRDNPLAARAFVNRVWQYHFGRGIVATSENFGKLGSGASHPELLDWLAADFMANGWKIKRLHRQILTSAAWRQATRRNDAGARIDPDNKLLWRQNLLRLEAEAVRDALLAASGKLDRGIGGPAIALKPLPDTTQTLDPKEPAQRYRRSLYIAARRNFPLQFLQVFDYPVMQVNCTRRVNSATPLQ